MNQQVQKVLRYLGKVKQQLINGQNGQFTKHTILLDNPNPGNKDGTPNQYYKGTLLWIDQETGKKYVVKQLELAGVSEENAGRGFINSIRVDLSNQYHVDEIE